MQEAPKIIELTYEEGEELYQKSQSGKLSLAEMKLLGKILRCYLWFFFNVIKELKISLSRLRKLLGFKTEKKKESKNKEKSGKNKRSQGGSKEGDTGLDSDENPPKGKGHGRRKASDYKAAKKVYIKHEKLKAGDLCPYLCKGRLYEIVPSELIRITGNALLSATHYIVEKLRCALCGAVFCACLPKEVNPKERYDEEAKAVIALQKYYLGLPFYRIERFQKYMGVPLSDATQFDMTEQIGNCANPIYKKLREQAAYSKIIHNDDTPVRILELMKENEENPELERKGMFTTGIVSEKDGHKIVLFFSGRQHAGENLKEILKERPKELGPIIHMSDALSANKPGEIETIACNCLSHARRNFFDIEKFFPEQCEKALNYFEQVYGFDKITKKEKMTDEERLEFHQANSRSVMKEFKKWLEEQIREKKAEPNSSLGKAIDYMLKRWPNFNRFLEVPGAPLDNNFCESCFKVTQRNRKNSYFFKTEHGATIGDILMSVTHTACLAEKNPFNYLVSIQKHHSLVHKNPEEWLPWTYEETLKRLEQEAKSTENRSPPENRIPP